MIQCFWSYSCDMSIRMDYFASKIRRTSLVHNVNINQGGRTSATFDMNGKVEVKEILDVVEDNLVPETESEESSGQRQRKLSKKGKEYKISLLQSRKQRLCNQLMRNFYAIDDLLYSKDHFTTVMEELQLFDDLFSQLLLLREEYNNCLYHAEDFSLQEFDNWLEDLDVRIFTLITKLETGLKKLKWIESQVNQWHQILAVIASHHQVHLQVHWNQDLQKKKQNYLR